MGEGGLVVTAGAAYWASRWHNIKIYSMRRNLECFHYFVIWLNLIHYNWKKIKQYYETKSNFPYYDTFAKDNINVEETFEEAAKLSFKINYKI